MDIRPHSSIEIPIIPLNALYKGVSNQIKGLTPQKISVDPNLDTDNLSIENIEENTATSTVGRIVSVALRIKYHSIAGETMSIESLFWIYADKTVRRKLDPKGT